LGTRSDVERFHADHRAEPQRQPIGNVAAEVHRHANRIGFERFLRRKLHDLPDRTGGIDPADDDVAVGFVDSVSIEMDWFAVDRVARSEEASRLPSRQGIVRLTAEPVQAAFVEQFRGTGQRGAATGRLHLALHVLQARDVQA